MLIVIFRRGSDAPSRGAGFRSGCSSADPQLELDEVAVVELPVVLDVSDDVEGVGVRGFPAAGDAGDVDGVAVPVGWADDRGEASAVGAAESLELLDGGDGGVGAF